MHEGGFGDLLQIHALVGAGHREYAAREFDIAFIRFHDMRGNPGAFVYDLARRCPQGGATDDSGARAVGADAKGDPVGIAINILDIAGVNAKAFRCDLAENGFMALALVLATH